MKKIISKEEKRELKKIYDNLQKFKQRTSGSPQLDQKIWDVWGHWLVPEKKIEPTYQIKVAKIPYLDKRDGKHKVMFRRQILVWTNRVHDSGKYRITYRGKAHSFTVTCMETNKRLHQIPYADISKFLGFYFNDVPSILLELFL